MIDEEMTDDGMRPGDLVHLKRWMHGGLVRVSSKSGKPVMDLVLANVTPHIGEDELLVVVKWRGPTKAIRDRFDGKDHDVSRIAVIMTPTGRLAWYFRDELRPI
jgi:hypothetical protein